MLSKAEQRKLTEIESHLASEDPTFVDRFRNRGRLRRRWHGRVALSIGAAAVMVAAFGLVLGSVGTVVVALTAIGASAGIWITDRLGS